METGGPSCFVLVGRGSLLLGEGEVVVVQLMLGLIGELLLLLLLLVVVAGGGLDLEVGHLGICFCRGDACDDT